jgi:hypothetical protein
MGVAGAGVVAGSGFCSEGCWLLLLVSLYLFGGQKPTLKI